MTDKEKGDKLSGAVYIVVLALIVDLLGFTVILPLIPRILELYSSNGEDTFYQWLEGQIRTFQVAVGAPDLFNKVLFGGFLGSMFSMLQYLSAPIVGALSDVYGRKPIMLLSMIGIGVSHTIWMFSSSFSLFVLARIVGGISKANVSLTAAIVTDLCSTKTRGRGMALVGAAFGIGFIIGPMIGAAFAAHSSEMGENFYIYPALFAVVMSVLDIILLCFFFKESLPVQTRAKSVASGLSASLSFINPVSIFTFKPIQNISAKDLGSLQRIGFIYFLFLFLYSGLEYSLTFLTHIRFMFTSMQQGKMYLFSGIVMIVIQGGVMRSIKPGNEIKTGFLGAIVVVPSFIIIGLARSIGALYFGLALYAFASATVVPCLTTIVSKMGASDQKGTVMGIFRSLGSLARGLGPLVSSIAYWCLGSATSYCIGGILLLIPAYLILRLKKTLEVHEAKAK